MTMGQSFQPNEHLLTYVEEEVCSMPRNVVRRLDKVTVPTPDGTREVTTADVALLWQNFGIDDVAEKSRTKKWDSSHKEKCRFLYVVAVKLSQWGFLDEHNKPIERALRETRHACSAFHMQPGVRIHPRFEDLGSQPQHPAASSSQNIDNLGSQPHLSTASVVTFEGNFKCILNEKTSGGVKYETVVEGDGFRLPVTLPDGVSCQGLAVASTKKEAEQLAAQAGLDSLSNRVLSGGSTNFGSTPAAAGQAIKK